MKHCNPLFERLAPEKQQRILSIASTEFASLGYRTANINIIADKCNISVGSLYKYFGTKENLFLSVCSLTVEALKSSFEKVQNEEGDFFKKVELIIRIIQKHSRNNPGTIHLYNEVTTQGNRDLAAKLSYEMESISADFYANLINGAKGRGEIDIDIDERMAAFCLDNLFMSLQFSYATEFYQERMKVYVDPNIFDDDERVVKGSMDFIRRALSAK